MWIVIHICAGTEDNFAVRWETIRTDSDASATATDTDAKHLLAQLMALYPDSPLFARIIPLIEGDDCRVVRGSHPLFLSSNI